ncbi:helix-turn-helix domain-containing GNAT family N-acetyltransferase [Achromobacter sp. AONIH1]|jgi:DNA-binding MarR family transcriptional regulator/GNAT superfamily N-acetyltransferase|uniref:bifunctional helix-turn-helix transcriptional regulator/GNAT family N-acetyltransferase n=1 Tax=unclassified Achromobacter TaxID=2626865 RepID=UPI000CD2EA47|nr:helix-turn-helix domain-containing GNAT family N-acetyltransferase [Achromobacter sp. AONIH1]AUT48020.1 MarR family transcriptional regulator [Achromobacter sp. AONIH1]
MSTDPSLVEDIRAASRSMVRELGFMQSTLAASGHSASAVHTLLEIDARGAMTAAQLAPFLGLDKSSISRMLAKLIEAGELEEAVAGDDARVKQLSLTRAGKRKVDQIHAYGRMQVNTAMARLNPSQRQAVAQGLGAYAQALQACRENDEAFRPGASNPITIHAGYQPGMIGRITEMHAAFYARHAGFGQFFESQVATGVAEFAGRLNQTGNHVWLALLNDRIVGSVAIDGQDLGNNHAHLRWFILDDGCRGSGVGRQLLAEAVAYCDRLGFAATRLWTFKGLDAARKLYESVGFQLVREEAGEQWGSTVTEQQFIRPAPLS